MALKGNIFEVQSLSELRGLGKLAEVKIPLKEAAEKEGIKIKVNSWDNVWESIQHVKKLTAGTKATPGVVDEAYDDLFFKSKAAKYIFILTQTDGETRMNLLGVDMRHYTDAKVAAAWMRDIAKCIHPDNCTHPLAEKAFNKLDEIYKVMTGK